MLRWNDCRGFGHVAGSTESITSSTESITTKAEPRNHNYKTISTIRGRFDTNCLRQGTWRSAHWYEGRRQSLRVAFATCPAPGWLGQSGGGQRHRLYHRRQSTEIRLMTHGRAPDHCDWWTQAFMAEFDSLEGAVFEAQQASKRNIKHLCCEVQVFIRAIAESCKALQRKEEGWLTSSKANEATFCMHVTLPVVMREYVKQSWIHVYLETGLSTQRRYCQPQNMHTTLMTVSTGFDRSSC